MSQFTPLTIKDIIQETPSSVSLVFDIPANKKNDFSFVAGQFLTLKAVINNKEVRRAYSISSHPSAPQIQISVKKIAGGQFSTFANESLKAGDTIDVMIPEGKFQLHPNGEKQKNYLAFAAGSGITPIMSMIKTVLSEEPNSKFVLVYGNKNTEETMFFKELSSLQTQNPERLFLEFVNSRENTEGSTFGRIEKSTVNFILKNKFSHINFEAYYLCGPEGMIETVSTVLSENGASKDSINYELFSSASTASSSPSENTATGSSTITITVDDEEFNIVADKQKTLLDAVLEQDIDAPYSCKGGVCCSCICRVTEGEVDMPVNNLLTDSEVAEGLVLACQAYAKSDALAIDFDDA